MRTEIIAHSYQVRAKRVDLTNFLARSGSNSTTEEWRTTRKLSTEALRKRSVTEWPFSIDVVQRI